MLSCICVALNAVVCSVIVPLIPGAGDSDGWVKSAVNDGLCGVSNAVADAWLSTRAGTVVAWTVALVVTAIPWAYWNWVSRKLYIHN